MKNILQAVGLSVWLGLVALSGSVAQEQNYNCADPQYQQEMNYCAYQDFLVADEKLNAVYGLAIAAAKKMDGYYEGNQQGAEQALREAQRAWVIFRDKACEVEGFVSRGGTMEPLLVSSCKARLTEQRTEGLRWLSEVNG